VPHEPLEMLEPDNLLEPMDLTDAQSGGGRASTSGWRDHFPAARSEDRMLPGGRADAPRPLLRRPGKRRLLTVGLLAVCAAACIGTGAALPGLARHSGAMHQRADTGAEAPAKTSANAGAAVASTSANDQAPQNTNDRSAAAVPCDLQTWPSYWRDCPKGPGAAVQSDPSPVRSIVTDRNPEGSPRITPTAAASAPPANSSPASSAAVPGANDQGPVAKPADAEKTAAAAAEPPRPAERSAREDRRRKARRAARLDRAQQAAQASGAAAAQPRERTADVGGGEGVRSGGDAEQPSPLEPLRHARRSAREPRSSSRDNGDRDRGSVREAEGRGNPDVDRRDDIRPYYRSAPDSGRGVLFPGYGRPW